MTRQEVSRTMRLAKAEQDKAREKARRFVHECNEIDRIVDGAKGG